MAAILNNLDNFISNPVTIVDPNNISNYLNIVSGNLNVSIQDTAGANVVTQHNFNTVPYSGTLGSTSIVSYTVPSGKNFHIKSCQVAGYTGPVKFSVSVDGSVKSTMMISSFTPQNQVLFEPSCFTSSGQQVAITAVNNSNFDQYCYGTIMGNLETI
jgi:hypothetical protein